MYGAITGSEWGKQSDSFSSDKFHDDTLEYLERIACENHPILERIRRREWDVEQLAKDYPARAEDVPEEDRRPTMITLADSLKEEYEENGDNSEWAQKLHVAINWKENSDEIETLREELLDAEKAKSDLRWPKTDKEKGLYYQNRQKDRQKVSSLRWAIRRTIAQDEYGNWPEDWNKDYDFREEFEAFLSNITSARQCFRERLWPDEEIRELVQKYLENPLWHLPQITNFLLVDLIDSDLIMVERDFYFGLFVPSIASEIVGPNSIFMPYLSPLHTVSPCLSKKAKKERWKWRTKKFTIGLGLIYILIGFWDGEKITDLLVNRGFPSWIFKVIWVITMLVFVLPPITSILTEERNKRRIGYASIFKQAHNLLNIRWDIYSGAYDAKTCIERLKKLDDQDLHISSLIYPLLELQLNSERESLPQR